MTIGHLRSESFGTCLLLLLLSLVFFLQATFTT
ncbi:BnaA04g11620D [Brassica napus]|uniref:BnaA04g11620D protein n=1 Tax=Brassica napus TaxID=3708 RepID=A0A078FSQ3_BRANA|nr:BnaA04g11620D [Brassica napus]